MTSPETQQMLAQLRSATPTPQQVSALMVKELERLQGTIQAAQGHWQTVMPGREWTPAQELEHTIIVNEGTGKVARLLLSDRPIPEVQVTPGIMRNGKRIAPSNTEPGGEQTPEELLERLQATRALLTVQAEANPQRTYPHPFLGEMDASDWLRVGAWHMRNHRLAVERGLQALGAEAERH